MANDEARNNAKARMTNELAARRSLSSKHSCLIIHLYNSPNFGRRVPCLESGDALLNRRAHLRMFVIPSSFGIRASAFLHTVALHRNRLPEFINSDECKDAVCHAALLARHVSRYPYLHRNGHRGPPDFLYSRITADGISYANRIKK